MRSRKLIELEKAIEELKTIKCEINKTPKKKFITSIPYLFTLKNGMVIPREQLLKNKIDGSAVIVAPIETPTVLAFFPPHRSGDTSVVYLPCSFSFSFALEVYS